MENAFAWLSQLFETVLKFFPHLAIVRSTHGGVKFRQGRKISEIKPGLCFYWPLITEIDVIPVARQTQNLPTQGAITKDGRNVALSGVVVYRINDVVKALSRNWDWNDTVNDIAMTAILPTILKHTYDDLIVKISEETLQDDLTRIVRSRLRKFGVLVVYVGLTDFTRSIALNHIGSVCSLKQG